MCLEITLIVLITFLFDLLEAWIYFELIDADK